MDISRGVSHPTKRTESVGSAYTDGLVLIRQMAVAVEIEGFDLKSSISLLITNLLKVGSYMGWSSSGEVLGAPGRG